MKLYKIILTDFHKSLNELSSLPVSVVFAYKLSELIEKVESETRKWQSARELLLQKYGDFDKNGKPKTNKDKTQYILKDKAAFDKEYNELINLDIELPKIRIDDIKELKITTQTIMNIKELLIP